jgi:hypothetical protein
MPFRTSLTAAVGVLAVSGTLSLAQSRLRPGQYELTTEMTSSGKTMPAIKAQECVTADVLKDQTKLLMSAANEQDCKIANLVQTADRMTFTFTCIEDGVRFDSNAEMTYGVDAYSGVVTTKTEGEVFTTKMSGKRIGECK